MNWMSFIFLPRYKPPVGTGASPSTGLIFMDASLSDLFGLTEATSNTSLSPATALFAWPRAIGATAPRSEAIPSRRCLVFRGCLDMVDDQDLHRRFSGFQFQSQLLLYRSEQRRRGRVGCESAVRARLSSLWLIRSPLQLDVVIAR